MNSNIIMNLLYWIYVFGSSLYLLTKQITFSKTHQHDPLFITAIKFTRKRFNYIISQSILLNQMLTILLLVAEVVVTR